MTLPTVVSDDMSVEDVRRANVQFPYFRGANAVGDFVDLIAAYNRTIRRVAAEEQRVADRSRARDRRASGSPRRSSSTRCTRTRPDAS